MTIGVGMVRAKRGIEMPVRGYMRPVIISVGGVVVVTTVYHEENRTSYDYNNLTGGFPLQTYVGMVSDFRYYNTPFRINVRFCLSILGVSLCCHWDGEWQLEDTEGDGSVADGGV